MNHMPLDVSRRVPALFFGGIFCLINACSFGTDVVWPFGKVTAGVTLVDSADTIGLANSHTGFLLQKSDGTLVGIWAAGGTNICALKTKTPLWSAEL